MYILCELFTRHRIPQSTRPATVHSSTAIRTKQTLLTCRLRVGWSVEGLSCHTCHQVALQKPVAYRTSFGTFAASLSLAECEKMLHHSLLFPLTLLPHFEMQHLPCPWQRRRRNWTTPSCCYQLSRRLHCCCWFVAWWIAAAGDMVKQWKYISSS